MSRQVPRGGLGPEWPNEPDDGQAYGEQGAPHNAYGSSGYNGNGHRAPVQNQHEYDPYGGPGRGAPGGYGQQSVGGQGGRGHWPQGYGPPGPRIATGRVGPASGSGRGR